MTNNSDRPSLKATTIPVIALALLTAGIHFYLVPDEFRKGATGYGTLFILTGMGYVAATALMYLPLAALAPFRVFGSVLMVGIAVAAIVAYISLGYFDTLGWFTKGIEAALVLAVVANAMLAGKSTDANRAPRLVRQG